MSEGIPVGREWIFCCTLAETGYYLIRSQPQLHRRKDLKTHDGLTFTLNSHGDPVPQPNPAPAPINLTLDSESMDCLRQCMKADRHVLEEDLGWPEWMVEEVCRVLENVDKESA